MPSPSPDPIAAARDHLAAADAELAAIIHVPRGIHAPSHFTPGMAARALRLHKSVISRLVKPGGELEPEEHWGTRLIPAHRVLRAMEKRGLL